jgi:hypothetical protein
MGAGPQRQSAVAFPPALRAEVSSAAGTGSFTGTDLTKC